MKVFKIKLWLSNGRTRDKSDVLVEILKRMKLTKFLEWNVTLHVVIMIYTIKQQLKSNINMIAINVKLILKQMQEAE